MDKLDSAAKNNLNPVDLGEYYRYKKELEESGETEVNIKSILIGFIWEYSENA